MGWRDWFKPKPKKAPTVGGGTPFRSEPYNGPDKSKEEINVKPSEIAKIAKETGGDARKMNEAVKRRTGGGSSSGSKSGGSSKSLSGQTPVYSGSGEVIGVEDGVAMQSRLPTAEEKRLGGSTTAEQVMTGTITKAPTRGDKYQEAVKQQGYVRGTLAFVGFQFQEKVAKEQSLAYSKGDTSAYYQSAGVTNLAGLAPQASYFIPVLGPSLLLGGGIESVGTSSGRGRISTSSEIISNKYNTPKGLTKVGIYGLETGGIFLGARGLNTDLNRLAKYPVSQTEFLGTQQRLTGTQGQPKIITDLGFKSTTKKLFGETTQIGISRTGTDLVKTTSGGLQVGESITFGASRNLILKPLKGPSFFGKPNQFNVLSGSISKTGPTTISKNLGKFSISQELELTQSISAGRGIIGKNIFTNVGKAKKFNFVSGSISGGNNPIFVSGKTLLVDGGKISKGGGGTYSGALFKPTQNIENIGKTYIGGGSTKSLLGQSQQVAFAQTSAGIMPKTSSIIPRTVPVPFQTSPTTTILQTPKTSLGMSIAPVVTQSLTSNLRLSPRTTPLQVQRNPSRTRSRTTPALAQLPAVTQTPRVTQMLTPAVALKTPQVPRTITPSTSVTPPIGGSVFIPPFFLPPPFDLGGSSRVGKFGAKRTYFKTPSIGELIKTRKFEATASTQRFTGLEVRDMTKKRKKKGKNSLFPFI